MDVLVCFTVRAVHNYDIYGEKWGKRVENMWRRKEESGDFKFSWERCKRMKIKTTERKGELEARCYF